MEVRIGVYDLAGRRVRLLVDEHREAGRHTVVWDGQDTAGRTAASGAYYLRLDSDDGPDLRKIMLLK